MDRIIHGSVAFTHILAHDKRQACLQDDAVVFWVHYELGEIKGAHGGVKFGPNPLPIGALAIGNIESFAFFTFTFHAQVKGVTIGGRNGNGHSAQGFFG